MGRGSGEVLCDLVGTGTGVYGRGGGEYLLYYAWKLDWM